jgi:hypothetical protein
LYLSHRRSQGDSDPSLASLQILRSFEALGPCFPFFFLFFFPVVYSHHQKIEEKLEWFFNKFIFGFLKNTRLFFIWSCSLDARNFPFQEEKNTLL